ncbi:MAG: hypothetical protein BMS9Abin17_0664 [Acidimicrobiia bacterium]|nr:MAG: hypothetical protein BMS9Abin17_0664 [Acidimicrobiia bacterium]
MPDPAVRRGIAAVVVAAGAGSRFGEPKHSVKLGGKPLWQWSVDAFTTAGIPEIVVVGDVPGGIAGGPRRRDSVLNGLNALTPGSEWVLVHDAARPLVSVALIVAIVDSALAGSVEGVIPGIPLTDTIKSVEGGLVVATVDRSGLEAVQTPQAFRTSVLLRAHNEAVNDDATDDATLVERFGGSVRVVTGDLTNIKITYPVDLALAESLLRGRGR